MPVAAPADRRFRRAHLAPGRRKLLPRPIWTKTARAALLIAAALYGAYTLINLMTSAGTLTVAHVAVTGNTSLSRGEVLSLLDGLEGQNMLTLNLEPWRHKLKASPWIADASFRRIFPATVTVAVVERKPLGIARIGTDLYLVDARGVIDEFGSNYGDLDLPVIDGLAPNPGDDAGLVDQARAALAARLLVALQPRPDLAKLISQIDVTDGTSAAVIIKGDTALVRLGVEHFVERLQSYLDLRSALRERVPEIDYVDLRFGERVYVRPIGAQATGSKIQAAVLRSPGAALRPRPSTATHGRGSPINEKPKGGQSSAPAVRDLERTYR
jgi:cell division protein FtsQ